MHFFRCTVSGSGPAPEILFEKLKIMYNKILVSIGGAVQS